MLSGAVGAYTVAYATVAKRGELSQQGRFRCYFRALELESELHCRIAVYMQHGGSCSALLCLQACLGQPKLPKVVSDSVLSARFGLMPQWSHA